jgi:hypothetical protein
MFLTHKDWAADTTARNISAPFLPWKVVTMTAYESKYVVKVSSGAQPGPETWFVSGIPALLDLTNGNGHQIRTVSILNPSSNGTYAPTLIELTEIREIETETPIPMHVYRTKDGQWCEITPMNHRPVESEVVKMGRKLLVL